MLTQRQIDILGLTQPSFNHAGNIGLTQLLNKAEQALQQQPKTPQPDIMPIIKRQQAEAIWSSRIEGIDIDPAHTPCGYILVKRCENALSYARHTVFGAEKHALIRESDIVRLYQILEDTTGGYRKLPGTVIAGPQGVVHTPPQNHDDISVAMADLTAYINDYDTDHHPLLKIAATHLVFETIHPFYDGNGRTGRNLIQLQLMTEGYIDMVIPLSKAIFYHRNEYYFHLRNVRNTGDWGGYFEWFVGMLARAADDLPV